MRKLRLCLKREKLRELANLRRLLGGVVPESCLNPQVWSTAEL